MSRALSTMEQLESRMLLSADLNGGMLDILGTGKADSIVIEGTEDPGTVIVFGVPGTKSGTTFRGVDAVQAKTGSGNDTFRINGQIFDTAGKPHDSVCPRRRWR